MKVRTRPYRKIRTAGSVMEIWPASNYLEHMPKGTPQQRMGQYWQNVGNQLCKSIKAYEQLSQKQ
ncbi:hypothetical protein [uncultured Halomonas sp.]|uniref:hypothetical protein n=1 Tax=uncultured Halomonas sp. TaxID=173971 RepID=UPI002636BE2C|nr:hypothetical protein [uncultured Halomonas sp.]